jgi:broad specificity phosphatase PhoE
MLLFLVRHAESTLNRARKFQGQKDPQLSPYGRREAKRLARRFKGLKFAAVYSSPLKRAYETARNIVGPRRKIICDEGLMEMGLGKWEGKTVAEVKRAYGDAFSQWAARPSRVKIPGGEDFMDFVARVKRTLGAIEKRSPRGNVLVVCHGGVISTFTTVLLNLPCDDIWCLTVKNASLTIADLSPGSRRLVAFNDTSHLMRLRDLKHVKETHVV